MNDSWQGHGVASEKETYLPKSTNKHLISKECERDFENLWLIACNNNTDACELSLIIEIYMYLNGTSNETPNWLLDHDDLAFFFVRSGISLRFAIKTADFRSRGRSELNAEPHISRSRFQKRPRPKYHRYHPSSNHLLDSPTAPSPFQDSFNQAEAFKEFQCSTTEQPSRLSRSKRLEVVPVKEDTKLLSPSEESSHWSPVSRGFVTEK